MNPQSASVFSFLKNELRLRSILAYVLVFLACFGSAKFGQYLFYTEGSSPAVIWPPFGIALGAMLVGGYRMWLPVALAQLFATFSAGTAALPVELASVVGQTIQPLVGAWAMQWLGFDGSFSRIRDAFILIGAAVLATEIAPTLSTLTQLLTHTLGTTAELTWIRSWAGGILSVLILTPLITTWYPLRPLELKRTERFEVGLAFMSLIAVTYFLFWTSLATGFGLTGIYVWLAVLVWITLRMEPRLVTLALLLTTVFGMAGTIIAHPTAIPINQQLFSDELVIEFVAIIFVVFCAIIEERRRARIALEENVVQLRQAIQKIADEDVAKNQFIATLAHELRNPLAPVVSALDLLTLQQPSPEALQTIEGAQRELSIMRRLLDDILDVARVSQTRFKLQNEIVDVRSLLERSVESTRVFLRNRNHTLTVSLPDEKVIVEVDPVRFQQIVVNLLNNAGKYTPPGGQITLSCWKDGARAKIQVRDNGVGIPHESLKEVFEPFRQIRPTTQLGTGLGIGLWLTKQLVEMHGGTIEAESEGTERGSRFNIYLPLKEVTTMQVSNKVLVSSIVPPMKVLIVDDNRAAAQAMQKLLRLKGHEPRIAYDGRTAISSAAEFAPRVILLDIGLPDMTGYDVARKLLAGGVNATIIALTGYGQEEDKQSAKTAGFDYHLTKPVGIADIERILAQLKA